MMINFRCLRALLAGTLLLTGLNTRTMAPDNMYPNILPARGSSESEVTSAVADLGSQLFNAVERGNESEVKKIINLYESSAHQSGVIPLMAKSPVNWADTTGRTPLMEAAANGNLEIVEILLDHGAHVNKQRLTNNFALYEAAANGHDQIVQLLLEKGAHANMRGPLGVTALIGAAQYGHSKAAQILLDHGADVNAQARGARNIFALWRASEYGFNQTVKLLLNKGADIDKPGINGATSLMIAAENGHDEVVRLLLKHGANANAQTAILNNIFALRQAAQNDRPQVVATLLTTIPNADLQAMRSGYFALLYSIGHHGMNASKDMRMLISNRFIDALVQKRMEQAVKPMIELADSFGETARDVAIRENHKRIANLLDLNNPQSQATIRSLIKADIWHAINWQEHLNEKLLDAAESGNTARAKELIADGANVNVEDGNATPLTLAAVLGHKNMCELLIAHGADVNAKTKEGETALSWASKKNKDICKLLINAMVKPSNAQKKLIFALLASLKKTTGSQYLPKDTMRLIAQTKLEEYKQQNKSAVETEINKIENATLKQELLDYLRGL